jgi:membrane protease YdiL (CAAX protease family)
MKINWLSNSRLFELARMGKRLTHILAVIPLSLIFSVVGQFGSIPVVFLMVFLNDGADDLLAMNNLPVALSGLVMGLFLITAFVLIYVFVALWVYFYERRPVWTLGYESRDALVRYARGFLLGLLMFGSSVGILWAFGAVSREQGDPARQGAAALGGILFVLLGWIIQGGAEEVLVRGWVLPVVGARLRPWVGLLVSSLLFATMHALNAGLTVLAFVNLALFGVFAALYALREGSLWGISALHSSWNWMQGNILGFEVSGMGAGGGSLIDLVTRGPGTLTGGVFGPEGGVAVTAVLLVGIAAILFWPVRSDISELFAS